MIALENVSKSMPGGFAVQNLDFAVAKGETLVLFGPSGCGKTTTLRLIAGFDQPDGGILRINGQRANSRFRPMPPHQRGVSMVFQDLALWPHMTVQQHLAFVLDACLGRKDHSLKAEKALQVLEQVRLTHKNKAYPHQLSGGEKQRLALARAFVAQPAVLLMDEPLSSLDAHLRSALLRDIQTLINQWKTTTVYVTHDWHEALYLADRIVVMNGGQVIKQLNPVEMRSKPYPSTTKETDPYQQGQDRADLDHTPFEPGARTGRP